MRDAADALRSARPASSGPAAGRPYILSNIPTYDILGEESLVRIENAADRILAEIGIEFRDDPATLEHWRRAGATFWTASACASSRGCCARS